jgi:hypothetical protein
MHADRSQSGREVASVTAAGDITRRAVIVYSAVFVVLACAAEIINRRFHYPAADSVFWEVLQSYRPRFATWFSLQNSDPLQGMFDIFPQGYRGFFLLDTIQQLPLAPDIRGALVYWTNVIYASFSLYVLARTVGMARSAALLAGILLPVLTHPGLFRSIPDFAGSVGVVTTIFALTPSYSYIISGVVLTIALFWRVDERLSTRYFVSALLALLIAAESCNALALHMTLMLPAAIVFGIGGLVASDSRRELQARLVWAIAVMLGLLALGIPNYLYSLGSNTAVRFFFNELNDYAIRQLPTNQNLFDDLFNAILWGGNQWAVWPAVGASSLGILTAMYFAVLDKCRKFRTFARSFLALIIVTGLLCFVCHFWFYYTGYDYKGPNPNHAKHILWPFHIIFISRAIYEILHRMAYWMFAYWSGRARIAGPVSHGIVLLALALPVFGTFALSNTYYFDMKPRPTPITEYLTTQSTVALGSPYRGTVAGFVGMDRKDPADLLSLFHRVQYELMGWVRNDTTTKGFWAYGIPTLTQESVTITPQYYLMLTEFLIHSFDRQARSFVILRTPDQAVLQLWGVRFIVTDYVLPFGAERLQSIVEVSQPVHFNSPLRVYELPHPNLGNYSPIRVIAANEAKDVISAFRDPHFDGRQSVVTHEAMQGTFVAAINAEMIVERGGLSLRASSAGESLLVLPVQYSRCWQLQDAPNATLFRANLMQLGIRFSGELRAQLRQVFGPLWNSYCRVEDAGDMQRLKISEARSD